MNPDQATRLSMARRLDEVLKKNMVTRIAFWPPSIGTVKRLGSRGPKEFGIGLILRGRKRYRAVRAGAACEIELRPGIVTFSVLHLPPQVVGDTAYQQLSVLFREEYTRFIWLEHCKGEAPLRGPTEWYHTGRGMRGGGRHVLMALCDLALAGDPAQEPARSLVVSMLHYARKELLETVSPVAGKARATWQAVREFLEENYTQPITRESVAQSFRLNPSYLSQLFARQGDEGFNTLLTRLRMEHAASLARDALLTNDEISRECGYENTASFMRAFKAFHGTSPGKLRRSKRIEQKSVLIEE